jgi:hypothetical protein
MSYLQWIIRIAKHAISVLFNYVKNILFYNIILNIEFKLNFYITDSLSTISIYPAPPNVPSTYVYITVSSSWSQYAHTIKKCQHTIEQSLIPLTTWKRVKNFIIALKYFRKTTCICGEIFKFFYFF